MFFFYALILLERRNSMLKILNNDELKQFITNEKIPCKESIFSIILDIDNLRCIVNGDLIIDCDKNILNKYL